MPFSQQMNDELDKLISSDPSLGLTKLRELARSYGNESSFQSNYGSRLIDLGQDLKDAKLLVEGISETSAVLNTIPPEWRSRLQLNIACAHRHLHQFTTKKVSIFDKIDSDELSTAKKIFNELKKKGEHI